MSNFGSEQRDGAIDAIQSGSYAFPYHYIPVAGKRPQLSMRWGFAVSYLAAIDLAQSWLKSEVAFQSATPHRHMDFGCGDGGFVYALNSNPVFQDVEFEGIDIDQRAIQWAELFSADVKNARFQCGDLVDLPAGSYDSGTLVEVLEHIPPDGIPDFVGGIAHALKRGAHLFVTVPSVEKPLIEKHYQHFDFSSIQGCFDHLFDIVDCFGFEKSTYLSRFFKKRLMRKKLYFETPRTSRMQVDHLKRKYKDLSGCGRIGVILKKK